MDKKALKSFSQSFAPLTFITNSSLRSLRAPLPCMAMFRACCSESFVEMLPSVDALVLACGDHANRG